MTNLEDHRDPSLYIVQLIATHGYSVETYDNIITEDGYILTAFRILNQTEEDIIRTKPVVLLMHGLLSNCADFVMQGPNRALAFVLSSQGYDVWLANARGRRVSRKHVQLDADKHEQYWKFSFHEMGQYDLPAFLNQIERVTGLRTLAYIGHSQGCILPFVLIDEKPEYNERFNLIVTLSPPIIVPRLESIPYQILNVSRFVWLTIMETTGSLEFPPKFVTKLISAISKRFTTKGNMFFALVTWCLYFLHGKTPEQLVEDDIPVLMQHYPDTTSAIVIKHLGQTYRTGLFKKFDYGPGRNLQVYGSENSPLYDLNKVTSPVVVFCSTGDIVARPQDVKVFCSLLPNCAALHQLENPKFNHSDLLFGKYAGQIVYPLILDGLNKYAKVK